MSVRTLFFALFKDDDWQEPSLRIERIGVIVSGLVLPISVVLTLWTVWRIGVDR